MTVGCNNTQKLWHYARIGRENLDVKIRFFKILRISFYKGFILKGNTLNIYFVFIIITANLATLLLVSANVANKPTI